MAGEEVPEVCLGCGFERDESAVSEALSIAEDAFVAKRCPRCGMAWGEDQTGDVVERQLLPVVVREYDERWRFERDAVRLRGQGYVVISVIEQQQPAGCLRILTLGLYSLVVKPTPRLLVTYELR